MSGIRLFCYLRRFFRLLLSLLLIVPLLSACGSKSSTDSGAVTDEEPLLEAKLTWSVSDVATVFEVDSTEGFPITGTLTFVDEKEDISYTGLTPTSFHNIKRGSPAVDHQQGSKLVLVKMTDTATSTTSTPDSGKSTDFSGLVIGGLALFGSQWVKDSFFGNSPPPAVPCPEGTKQTYKGCN